LKPSLTFIVDRWIHSLFRVFWNMQMFLAALSISRQVFVSPQ